jgi:hypothetical protein
MSACSVTLSSAVRKSSSRWSWNAMPTSVTGRSTVVPPIAISPLLRDRAPRPSASACSCRSPTGRRPRRTRRPRRRR